MTEVESVDLLKMVNSGAVNAMIMARVPARSWLWENGSYAYAWDWTSGEESCDPIADIISNDEVHICRTHLRTKYLCAQNVYLYFFLLRLLWKDVYLTIALLVPPIIHVLERLHTDVLLRESFPVISVGNDILAKGCRCLLVMAAVYILVWNRHYFSHNVEAHHLWVCWPCALRY